MVQIHVSQLRKALPEPRLHTRPPGYLLEVADDELDLARFERSVGRRPAGALARATPQQARQLLARRWRSGAGRRWPSSRSRSRGTRARVSRSSASRRSSGGSRPTSRSATTATCRRARGADRRAPAARAPALAAHARALPVGPPGRGARQLPGVPAHARRRARDRAVRVAAGARAPDAAAGPGARAAGTRRRAPRARGDGSRLRDNYGRRRLRAQRRRPDRLPGRRRRPARPRARPRLGLHLPARLGAPEAGAASTGGWRRWGG